MSDASHLYVGQLRRTQQHALLKKELDLYPERRQMKLKWIASESLSTKSQCTWQCATVISTSAFNASNVQSSVNRMSI